ncbi:MAG: homoserine kinase [Pseudomonadales bacterium]|jgi:homoserine kinase type II|nr:homoserine kinase [Pseudomonadales bacterium]
MGVYSELSRDVLAAAIVGWGRGLLLEAAPTELGIENSNFFVSTEDTDGEVREWVLTVMAERPSDATLTMLELLETARMPVPAPVPDLDGRRVGRVDGHPALLTPRLPGGHPERPTPAQCHALGDFLGRMHRLTARLEGPPHPRDLAWLEAGYSAHVRRTSHETGSLLRSALDALRSVEHRGDWHRMPTGLIHGDLFRDNTMFDGDVLTGVIDFHHAARAPLAFDLAVAAMDWCSGPDGRLDAELTRMMLDGYARRRSLTREELWFWPLLLVLACARFLVARLHSPRKAPEEQAARLADRLARPMYLHPELLPRAA